MKSAIKLTATHAIVQQILARSLTADPKIAAVFFEYSAHVSRFELRGYVGGWRRDRGPDFEAAFYLNDPAALQSAAKMLEALDEFLASAPVLLAAREKAAKEKAADELRSFGEAVRRHSEARKAGAPAKKVHALEVACFQRMAAIKGCGLWWDVEKGLWGIRAPLARDEEPLTAGGSAGPHT